MLLYDKDDCPFCWKVRAAAAELGIALEIVAAASEEGKAGVARHSPQGTSPVLVDGDLGIWESAVIVEYLDDLAGGRLLGGDAATRARARLLQVFSDRVVGEGLREVVFEKRSKPQDQWDLERIAKGEALWRGHLGWLEASLGEAEFFLGDFSVAECALYPRFAMAARFGVGVDDRHPSLKGWFERLKDRPSIVASRPEG